MTSDEHDPRRFELVRREDETGVSGTGVVAVGVEWPDGAVSMQWLNADNDTINTDSNGMAFKPAPDGIEDTIEIHGHDGRTKLRWADPERGYSEILIAEVVEESKYRTEGDYVVAYCRTGDDTALDGMEPIAREELPTPLSSGQLTQWLAESPDAYELLREHVGEEGASQIRADTIESPLYADDSDSE